MTDVSRETTARLDAYTDLVRKWNPAINLVSKRDLRDLDRRHVADSLQLVAFADGAQTWCDLGSGGGFPGIVVSAALPDLSMTLIESDRRKAAFLSTVIRELRLNCTVICERSENAPPSGADVVSARALAPLTTLLALAIRHGGPDARYIFPKGSAHADEIRAARTFWRFDVDLHPSATEKEAVILELRNIERV